MNSSATNTAAREPATSFDCIADELVVEIIIRLPCAVDIGRCALLSHRFLNLIARDPKQYVWRRASKRAAHLAGLAGPWLRFAASAQGWLWVRRALDPWIGPARGLGFVRRAHRVDLGEYDKQGKHGTLVSIIIGHHWRLAAPVDDTRSCHVQMFFNDGDTYDGQMQHGHKHGLGTHTCVARDGFLAPTHIECFWMYGKRHGTVTVDCGCRCPKLPARGDDATHSARATSVAQSQHDSHGTDPSQPYGYRSIESWNYGVLVGPYKRHYCNGDLFECKYDRGTATDVRMVLSPYCPDPRFRSVEIVSAAWRHETVSRIGNEKGSFTLSFPDPAAAPDMFRVYHDYFRAGFLPVEERDRSAIATVLDGAATTIPAT